MRTNSKFNVGLSVSLKSLNFFLISLYHIQTGGSVPRYIFGVFTLYYMFTYIFILTTCITENPEINKHIYKMIKIKII